MPKFDKNRFEIEMLSRAYMNSKRTILEHAEKTISASEYKLEVSNKIVRHIENVIYSLDEQDRYILINEVLKGRRGKWFLDYTSAPTYYRDRKRAYANFLRCL